MQSKNIWLVIVLLLLVGGGVWFFSLSDDKITGNIIAGDLIKEVPEGSTEMIDKRTYNSRTFQNSDGTFQTEIMGRDVFFFDGEQFVELSEMSEPLIEKKIIPVAEIPESNVFDFGSYVLHQGVRYYIEEDGSLSLKDAKNKTINILPRPYAIDSEGDVSYGEFLTEFDSETRELGLDVEISRDWLDNAEYPIEVDPLTLSNSTGVYDGWVDDGNELGDDYSRDDVGSVLRVGVINTVLDPIHRSFIQFNTSSIPDSATIERINLTVQVTKTYGAGDTVSISRFGHTCINDSNFPDDDTGNEWLYNNISVGGHEKLGNYLTGLTEFQTTGAKNISLSDDSTDDASVDLQSLLEYSFFTIGLIGSDEYNVGNNDHTEISSSNVGGVDTGPRLLITYSITSDCTYSGSGDWTINESCQFADQNLTVFGDLHIYDNGEVNLTGNTNLTFVGGSRYIYVYRKGIVNIEDKAGINTGLF